MPERTFEENVYTRLGARPLINANIPFTFLGGTTVRPEVRRGSNRFLQMVVRWDEEAFALTADECARQLREGDPPISVLSNYNPYVTRVREFFPPGAARERKGSPLTVYALSLKPDEEPIVGERLRGLLQSARTKGPGNG